MTYLFARNTSFEDYVDKIYLNPFTRLAPFVLGLALPLQIEGSLSADDTDAGVRMSYLLFTNLI